ncbi:hypothetical protein [Labrys wisconsinensis]|uniref:Calcineurin-like phosphoesterase family protein n=1 Tax=Labrys wisconsinensis TaxID=425677 RepID=A0ABU0JJU7_9HYPH|nr:hypothetical protein [Labrys wisconsinensis]MDQ0474562.1 calcineurin-like phosphoesterase family protein [Labrys wisconsinensis]
MIFFTSDTHFQHARIIPFSRRPFASADEMDDVLVRNWRERITDDDVVYHLGDVTWKWNARIRAMLDGLPGVKHLIVGNHDHSNTRGAAAWASVQSYAELAVDVPEGGRRLIVLCHYPFAVWRDSHHGSINLHGHVHGRFQPTAQQMDVGVDCTDYAPITLPEVLTRLATYPAHVHRDLEELP